MRRYLISMKLVFQEGAEAAEPPGSTDGARGCSVQSHLQQRLGSLAVQALVVLQGHSGGVRGEVGPWCPLLPEL